MWGKIPPSPAPDPRALAGDLLEADQGPPSRKPAATKRTMSAACACIIAATIALEGGYVNNPADPGGETNMGVTKRVAVAEGYTGPMRQLPRDVATSIYFERYMVAPGYEPIVAIDAPVAEELFDTSVNMGASKPSRWFQQSITELCGISIVPDGKVGPVAIAAYSSCQARRGATSLCVAMLNSLDGKQRAEYERLVRANPKLRRFLKGWLANRVGNVDRRKCGAAR
jgi:lysozyme family protein